MKKKMSFCFNIENEIPLHFLLFPHEGDFLSSCEKYTITTSKVRECMELAKEDPEQVDTDLFEKVIHITSTGLP